MLKIGIVGLPNVGKSTLFNAITNSEIEAANYPFATIEPNVGVVEIKDERLDFISDTFNSKKKIYNQITFVDIAGLVQGASKGEGLGNKFLSNIREVDTIMQVIRLFENEDIVHVDGNVDPIRDIETINLELILSDIEQINKWLVKNEGRIKSGNGDKKQLDILTLSKQRLMEEKKLSEFDYETDELEFLNTFQFLSLKPVIYIGNVDDEELSDPSKNIHFNNVNNYLKSKNELLITVSAQIEYEISKLNDDDKKDFLETYNLTDSGINKVSKIAFSTLGLETYFTAGPQEAHAWAFKKGSFAPSAAGIIHSDFEKGFIKAEVYNFNDLTKFNNEQKLKENGLIRIEGKEYKIQDGDIVHFRFNN